MSAFGGRSLTFSNNKAVNSGSNIALSQMVFFRFLEVFARILFAMLAPLAATINLPEAPKKAFAGGNCNNLSYIPVVIADPIIVAISGPIYPMFSSKEISTSPSESGSLRAFTASLSI